MKTIKSKLLSVLLIIITLITCMFSFSACKTNEAENSTSVPEVEEPAPTPPPYVPKYYTVTTKNGGEVTYGTKDMRFVTNEKSIADNDTDAINYKKGSATGMILTGGETSSFLIDEEIAVDTLKWNGNTNYEPLISINFTPNLNSVMKFNHYVQGNETYNIPYVYEDKFSYLPYQELSRMSITLYDAENPNKFLRLKLHTASSYEENRYTYTGYVNFQDETAKDDVSNVTFYNRNGFVNDNVTKNTFFCPIGFSGTNPVPFTLCVANNNLYIADYGKIEGANHNVVRNLKSILPSGKFKVGIEFTEFVGDGKNVYIYRGYGKNCSKVVQEKPQKTSIVISNFNGRIVDLPA